MLTKTGDISALRGKSTGIVGNAPRRSPTAAAIDTCVTACAPRH
jgi:hypothetical protein